MRLRHTILGLLAIVTFLAVIAALSLWYQQRVRLHLAEKALITGQSVTIPVTANALPDLSKPATPPTPPATKTTLPHIAVLITHLGSDTKQLQTAIGLPAAVALALLPDTPHLNQWGTAASAHPLLLELPETIDNSETFQQQEEAIASFANYTGVYTQAHVKTLLSVKNMSAFLDSVKARNLLFIYYNEGHEDWQQETDALSLTALEATLVINEEYFPTISSLLAESETSASMNGQALIVIESPSPAAFLVLTNWLASLNENGFKLVPVTDLVRKIE